jgi:hypothetical protein
MEMPTDEHGDQGDAGHDDAGSGADEHSSETGGHDD